MRCKIINLKNIILLLLILSNYLFAGIHAVVSILPQKTFVEAIGGDMVTVTLMVLPGNSPHTYEPKPSQMKDISKAELYFAIGVEFENIWLDKFKNLNKSIEVIDLSHNIEKLSMLSHHKKEHSSKHQHQNNDPHIWTSPDNVQIIAKNIFEALVSIDPDNRNYYKQNYDKFISLVVETDREIKTILSKRPNRTNFMVFHPSWGYFAKTYGLQQLSVEIEGKAPKPKELIDLMREAKKERISAIFTQPEFSDNIAKVIANELHIKVIKVSPLSPNWSKNLINIANAIVDGE